MVICRIVVRSAASIACKVELDGDCMCGDCGEVKTPSAVILVGERRQVCELLGKMTGNSRLEPYDSKSGPSVLLSVRQYTHYRVDPVHEELVG